MAKQASVVGRNSPALSSSSSITNVSDTLRVYNAHHDGRNRHDGSLSPSGSITSIHDAYFLNDRIRGLESEKLALMIDHNNLIREFNKRMEAHLDEIRNLKEANQSIEQECNELRELCCFLDDDRHKCRKLAKEWQRFGKHTVAVMRTEVMSYQEKLRSLESRQTELIKENSELRDLCVYLDSQRTGTFLDESSAMMKYTICKSCSELKKMNTQDSKENTSVPVDERTAHLQNQVIQLEREKESLHKLLMYGGRSRHDKKRVSFSMPTDDEYDSSSTTSEVDRLDFPPNFGSTESFSRIYDNSNILRNGLLHNTLGVPRTRAASFNDISPRNSDVIRIKENTTEDEINDIKEKLKRRTGEANLSEHEISLLKDMCNVVTPKKRSGSKESLSSLNNSFDLASPLSPPPNIGLPLYNTRRRGSSDLLLDQKESELSSIAERREDVADDAAAKNDESSVIETKADSTNAAHVDDMNDIDEIVERINSSLAGSIHELSEQKVEIL